MSSMPTSFQSAHGSAAAGIALSEAYHPSKLLLNRAIRDVIVNSPQGTALLYEQGVYASIDHGQLLAPFKQLHASGHKPFKQLHAPGHKPFTACSAGSAHRCQGRSPAPCDPSMPF